MGVAPRLWRVLDAVDYWVMHARPWRVDALYGPEPETRAIDPAVLASFHGTFQEQRRPRMLPLYAARISDLGSGDFVKVDCAACHHVALLTAEALLRGPD